MTDAVSNPAAWPWSTNSRGTRLSNLENVMVAFECDAELQRCIWFDRFTGRLMTEDESGCVREWADVDDVRTAVRLSADYDLKQATAGQVRAVADARARRFPKHAVCDWLEPLVWDGVPRIAEAFEDHWGAATNADQPADYVRAASRNFFVSLVARVLRPGCKVDTMPVFEGTQGTFKSSALSALVGEQWHTTAHEAVTSKDFFQALPGKWLIEIAELDTFTRAEVSRVKSVMSTASDRYRPSYGRSAQDFPRQCVFAGTVNLDNWGRDETGLRRFWPIQCGTITLTTLRAARAQLFAEAVSAFNSGATWWEMPESTTAVQAARQQESAISDAVLPWLLGKTETTVYDVCAGPLKLDAGRINRSHEWEVGRVLRLAGWTKRNLRRDGQQRKVWVAPGWADATSEG